MAFTSLRAALLCAIPAAWAQPYVISTFAGGVVPTAPIPAIAASIGGTTGIATDGLGNLYIATTLHCVFKVDTGGTLSRVAGTCRPGYTGDFGPATSAQLSNPRGLATDSFGNLYIADTGNSVVRKVTSAGTMYTVAGTGVPGFSGDGGAGTSGALNQPYGLATDVAGDLYIGDAGNNRVRMVNTSGNISTYAGSGTAGYSGDGGSAAGARLNYPSGLSADRSGNLFIADTNNNAIRKVSAAGVITTAAGNGHAGFSGDGGPAAGALLNGPYAVLAEAGGLLVIGDSLNSRIRQVTADGIIRTLAATGDAYSLAPDPAGNTYLTAGGTSGYVRRITPLGAITTVAGNGLAFSGDGGPAAGAQLFSPGPAVIDSGGNLFFADTRNWRVRKVSSTGIISTVAGNGTSGFSGDGGPAVNAQVSLLSHLAVDGAGNLYFGDSARVRKVSAGGIISTVAGNGVSGFSGDGGLATAAQVNFPLGMAADASGNLYIADTTNHRVRRVSAAGIIVTVAGNGTPGFAGDQGTATAAQLDRPAAVAVDAASNLFILDAANGRIRKVTPGGIITTLASGQAMKEMPRDLALDSAGNLYLTSALFRVFKVSPGGFATLIAGTGTPGYSGDGGPALTATLTPYGVAVDHAGAVYVTDSYANAVRKLQPLPVLMIAITHTGNLTQGQTNVPYTIHVSNQGGAAPTSGKVTVTDAVPAGLTLVSLSGPGWTCAGNTCSRGDTLAAGASYPSLTALVNVSSTAPSQVSTTVSVVGGLSGMASALDTSIVATPPPPPAVSAIVNAASFAASALAPNAYGTIFGANLAAVVSPVQQPPFPTAVGQVSVSVMDSTGAKFPVPLYFVSPGQINFLAPPGLASGAATLLLTTSGSTQASVNTSIAAIAPGLFSADGTGTGTAAGQVLASAGEVYLVLYGTGIRGAKSVTVTIGGVGAEVLYAGAQTQFPGLDQINARAAGLGSGIVSVVVSADGVSSNTLTIALP